MELLIQILIVLFVGGLTLLAFKSLSGVNPDDVVSSVKEKKDLIIRIVVVIVVCTVTLFLTNTQVRKVGKNTYINNFEAFVVKVQENHKDYSKEDWTVIEEEYQELSEKQRQRYEKLFTEEDKKRIRGLEGEYLSYRTGGRINNVFETIEDGFNNAVEYVDGFIKGLKKNDLENDTVFEEDTIGYNIGKRYK